MKIVILTQSDDFFIPINIDAILKNSDAETVMVAVINSKGSLSNKKSYFLKGFGYVSSARYALKIVNQKFQDLLDRILSWKIHGGIKSMKSICEKNGIPLVEISDPNDEQFLEKLKSLKIDLIVSYSAPVVFKEKLLKLPEHGCINLHCSMLPNYAGLMPSFWVLHNMEKSTGATVHYMDTKIDNGKIINQQKVDLDSSDSVVDVIRKTKYVGGKLIVETIKQIANGTVEPKENNLDGKNYHSWPKEKDFKKFRENGKRFC